MVQDHTIYHNLTINASTKEVFDAISNPKKLNHWWTLKCTGKPEIDAEYNLYFAPQYNWFGKVDKVIPNVAFFIKMTKADEDWNPTTFGFQLKKLKKGTLLLFSHSGWKNTNNHFKHSSFCWALLLNGLKKYIEKGEIIPFENRS